MISIKTSPGAVGQGPIPRPCSAPFWPEASRGTSLRPVHSLPAWEGAVGPRAPSAHSLPCEGSGGPGRGAVVPRAPDTSFPTTDGATSTPDAAAFFASHAPKRGNTAAKTPDAAALDATPAARAATVAARRGITAACRGSDAPKRDAIATPHRTHGAFFASAVAAYAAAAAARTAPAP